MAPTVSMAEPGLNARTGSLPEPLRRDSDAAGIQGCEARGIEGREINGSGRAIEDQFGHCLSCRGSV